MERGGYGRFRVRGVRTGHVGTGADRVGVGGVAELLAPDGSLGEVGMAGPSSVLVRSSGVGVVEITTGVSPGRLGRGSEGTADEQEGEQDELHGA